MNATTTAAVTPKPSRNQQLWARWSEAGTKETIALTSVLALAVAGGLYLVVATFRGLGDVPAVPDDAHHGQIIVGLGFAAFLLGRFAHRVRRRAGAVKPHETPRAGVAAATHIGLLVFFLVGTFAVSYEAVGLWTPPGGDSGVNPWGLQPITHYVRYAKEVAAPATGVVAVVTSFLVGHWLWPPAKQAQVPPPGTSGATITEAQT